jgi:hypothetical protein
MNISVGEAEEERPLVRPRRRWDDNIRIDIKEIGWGGTRFIWLNIGISGRPL